MEDKDKLTIATSLQKLEKLVKANVETTGEAFEAEERSKNNELLAVALSEFGSHVADVSAMAQEQKDHVEQMYEHMKLEIMATIDPDNKNAKGEVQKYTATKAESMVKTDLGYIDALNTQRSLERSKSVLTRKEKSLYAILDQSRSRYSLVNKDRIGGN